MAGGLLGLGSVSHAVTHHLGMKTVLYPLPISISQSILIHQHKIFMITFIIFSRRKLGFLTSRKAYFSPIFSYMRRVHFFKICAELSSDSLRNVYFLKIPQSPVSPHQQTRSRFSFVHSHPHTWPSDLSSIVQRNFLSNPTREGRVYFVFVSKNS